MIKVKYIKDIWEDTEEVIEEKEFPESYSRWDKEIEDYTYNKLLDLDNEYNFYDWENAPSITEVIYDDIGKVISMCSCIELYYNL